MNTYYVTSACNLINNPQGTYRGQLEMTKQALNGEVTYSK